MSEPTPLQRYQAAIGAARSRRPVEDDKVFTSVTWTSPDTAAALAVVDDHLRLWAGRDLVEAGEAMDALLDIRTAMLTHLDEPEP